MIKDCLPGEIWRLVDEDIDTFVSNYGRFYRPATTVIRQQGDATVYQPIKAKYLCGAKLSPKGYARIHLGNATYFAHRLVAKYFVPNPLNKPQVNHIDGDKTNNRAENLEWATNQENRNHAVRNGLHPRGETSHAKLSEQNVIEIRARCAAGETQRSIAKYFGVGQQTVSKIVRGEAWKHLEIS